MENLAAVGFLWASSTRIAIDVGVRPLSAIWAARKRTRPRRRVASAKVDYNPPVRAWSCTQTIVVTSVHQHRAAPSVRGIF